MGVWKKWGSAPYTLRDRFSPSTVAPQGVLVQPSGGCSRHLAIILWNAEPLQQPLDGPKGRPSRLSIIWVQPKPGVPSLPPAADPVQKGVVGALSGFAHHTWAYCCGLGHIGLCRHFYRVVSDPRSILSISGLGTGPFLVGKGPYRGLVSNKHQSSTLGLMCAFLRRKT